MLEIEIRKYFKTRNKYEKKDDPELGWQNLAEFVGLGKVAGIPLNNKMFGIGNFVDPYNTLSLNTQLAKYAGTSLQKILGKTGKRYYCRPNWNKVLNRVRKALFKLKNKKDLEIDLSVIHSPGAQVTFNLEEWVDDPAIINFKNTVIIPKHFQIQAINIKGIRTITPTQTLIDMSVTVREGIYLYMSLLKLIEMSAELVLMQSEEDQKLIYVEFYE